jgi:hypothetical protein
MPAAAPLINRRTVAQVIGEARLQRLLRAGWLAPVIQPFDGSRPQRQAILFNPLDVHKALRRLERQACPPDRIAVAQVRACELRNGRAYVPHPRPEKPALELNWDLDAIDLTKWKRSA